MSFKIRGDDYTIIFEIFAEWLEYNNEGILNTSTRWTFTFNFLWHDLGGLKPYYGNLTKSTGFSHPIIRILHQMLPFTLNARKNTSGHVSVWDLVLLKVIMDGKQLDLAKWLSIRFLRLGQFRMIVTFIVTKLQVFLKESDKTFIQKFKVNQWINIETIFKMRLIEKT